MPKDRTIFKVARKGLILRGFRCGESKTVDESKVHVRVLVDEGLYEFRSIFVDVDDIWLIGFCTPA